MTNDTDVIDEFIPEEETPKEETGKRLCACGCGTPLSPLTKFDYIRGHKLKAFSGDFVTEESSAEIDLPKPVIKLTKKVRDDLEAKINLLLTVITLPIVMKDPICGEAISDNLDNITTRLVPVLCKSPQIVEWLTKGENATAWLDLIVAIYPVAQVVASHHITHTVGTEQINTIPNAVYDIS